MDDGHQLAQVTPSLAMESLSRVWHCYLCIVGS